ncbi:MAG: NAD(P)-dependent oxidoreductase [Chlamydiae bacterium]|nr:NAD(P)-dependent oxidoreductase [Chlamydiota bacterium]
MSIDRDIVLITGVTGKIGFRLSEKLTDYFQVVGFDVFLSNYVPGVDVIGVDISSEESIDDALNVVSEKYGRKIASVIHLASYFNPMGGNWSYYQKTTIEGTEKLFRGLRKHNFEVEQFVFLSTLHVHASCKSGDKIDENSPIFPKWNYPKSKVLTEDMIHRMQGDIPSVIFRVGGVYDNKCHCPALSNQIQRIYENRMDGHIFTGNIHHGDSYIHIDDLTEAVCIAINKRKELPHDLVLLAGEDEVYSYDRLQREIAKSLFDKDWKTFSIPKGVAKLALWIQNKVPIFSRSFVQPWMIDIADDHFEIDSSRIKKVLGWSPKHKLIDIIPYWVEQLVSDPISWYEENNLKPREKIAKELL